MAEIELANEDTILRALQSSGVAMYGPTFNVQQYSGLSAEQLRQFALPSFSKHLQNGTSLDQTTTPSRFSANGPRLVREDIVARKADILGGQASVTDVMSYESMAFLFGGYQMNMDGKLDDQERTYMDEFLSNLDNNIDLSATFQNNVQVRETVRAELAAQAEAEAQAAAEIAERTNQISAGLVYGNFLDRADINNPNAVANAFNNMLAEHRDDPGVNIYELQSKAFVDPDNGNWTLSEDASSIFMELNGKAALSSQFRSDLESLDAGRVTLAQNYMNLHGKDVAVTGEMNPQTFDKASELLAQPVSIEGIPQAAINGMAAHGQLLLPQDQEVLGNILEKGELAYYNALFSEADRAHGTFGMSKEQFLADTLINKYPEEYESFLQSHNNADVAPLNVPEHLTKVEVDFLPETPAADIVAAAYTEVVYNPEHSGVDVSAVINNPYGVEAADETVIGGSSTLSEALEDQSIAVAPSGEMVFTQQYLVAEKVAEAISGSAIDGKITMGDALGVMHSITQTDHEALLSGSLPGGSARPSMREGQYVTEQLGYPTDHEFDLTNPKEFAAVMTGTFAYANQYDIPGDKHYINNLLDQQAAANPTIIALGQDIQMVADVKTGAVDALPQGTQFATAHGIVDAAVQEVSPETVQVAEPAATAPLPQSRMVLEDADVAKFYNDGNQPSNMERLMDPSQWTPAYGSIIPTPSMITPNNDIQTTINLKAEFGANASPITTTPPVGMDIENPANANMSQANPDIFGAKLNQSSAPVGFNWQL